MRSRNLKASRQESANGVAPQETGAEDEHVSSNANCRCFARWSKHQRVAVSLPRRS